MKFIIKTDRRPDGLRYAEVWAQDAAPPAHLLGHFTGSEAEIEAFVCVVLEGARVLNWVSEVLPLRPAPAEPEPARFVVVTQGDGFNVLDTKTGRFRVSTVTAQQTLTKEMATGAAERANANPDGFEDNYRFP